MKIKYDGLQCNYTVIASTYGSGISTLSLLKLNEIMCMQWFLILKLNSCVNYNYYVLELNI